MRHGGCITNRCVETRYLWSTGLAGSYPHGDDNLRETRENEDADNAYDCDSSVLD